MTQRNRNSLGCLSFFALLALAGCKAESENSAVRAQYQAEVIRTEYGVAHISADSYGGLGYGEAYAAAEDHVCNMALALAQSRGESAAALGMDATSASAARDIVVKALKILAERGRPSQSKVQTFVSGCRATPLATTIFWQPIQMASVRGAIPPTGCERPPQKSSWPST